MRVFRRVMLGGGIDIDSLPDTQKLYYKATTKVTPKSNSLGSPVIANKWDATTGEGIIVCVRDIIKIGDDAFNNYRSLTSVTIPEGVTSIGMGAFWECGLTSINIPNSVTEIGECAFYYCTSLKSVTIPDSVNSIGDYAFKNCSSLTNVTIGSGVTSIGDRAFYGCTSMQYYDFSTHESVPTLANTNAFSSIPSTCKIIVPDALYDEWIAATNWSTYASYIIKKSDWRTEAPDGVSIQHINGKFYTTDAWVAKGFSNDDANGVAVKNEQCGFVIAKTYFLGAPWSSDASNLVNGILTTTSSTEAKMDFAGAANTELMLATDTSGAAYICSNYTFPNGAKGYLPAAGEADVITRNRTTINSAMTLINGNTVPNNPLWSSTQYSSTAAWVAWNRSLAELEKKQVESCYIVVVTAIKNEDGLTTNTEEVDYVEYTE